jgi:hypothetical protein
MTNGEYHKKKRISETKPQCSARYLENGPAIIEGLHERMGQREARGEGPRPGFEMTAGGKG